MYHSGELQIDAEMRIREVAEWDQSRGTDGLREVRRPECKIGKGSRAEPEQGHFERSGVKELYRRKLCEGQETNLCSHALGAHLPHGLVQLHFESQSGGSRYVEMGKRE